GIDVPAARPVARGARIARPERHAAQRHGPPPRPERGYTMKDALGEVQSILVLGGTSDIARASCKQLVSQRGARVVLAARKPESCDAIAAELRSAGASEVDTVAFDATDFASHEAFVRSTFDRFGDFDVVLV